MDTLLVAILSFVGFIVAYHTYGRWLARKIFKLEEAADVPSVAQRDDIDYCPTRKEVIFGHHFTSIAGTGPIVGPAIAVFWGWLPALIWVLVGSIFIGAVHDFGSLVVSMRNRGQSIGDVAGRMIAPRARILFLLVLLFSLSIVLGIFGLVIAVIFAIYPESVLSVWVEIPLALAIGYWVYKRNGKLLVPSLAALAVMYIAIGIGTRFPISFNLPLFGLAADGSHHMLNAVSVWTVILFVYCFVASVLPVWTLLQPRDYINSHELLLALGLLVLGLFVAGASGEAQLLASAPAIATNIPADAPPIWPFLFIVVACGACSGFHSLVSSGTSSKQVKCEPDAQAVGYGSMLLEASLAVIVIMACVSGIGMGLHQRVKGEGGAYSYAKVLDADNQQVRGRAAWEQRYSGAWGKFTLGRKVGAFIDGGGNFLAALGIPLKFAIGIMAVLVASFAATTLDTATRLQRYVVQELGRTVKLEFLGNKYVATAVAVALGLAVAMIRGPKGAGSGGLILWPVFGATNQLLGCLAFLVIIMYLRRKNLPVWFVVAPFIFMLVMPTWAMVVQIHGWWAKWADQGNGVNLLLFGIGLCILVLQAWLIVEAALVWRQAKGNYPGLEGEPSSTPAAG